ncbi:WXG100 family type VII secretion target [Amycolatopsis sp. NPDC049868]|uniref:WXG100 family type VII secretion target n=1 Tax=Amycolatopsis sp. NPDC049868 TaxID=3363934 RepID=UPI0037AB4954
MTSPTSVSTPAMQKAAGEFEAALSTSNTTQNNMQNNIQQLNVAWTGDASVRFKSSMNAWCREYQNIVKELGTMLEALHGNTKSYVKTEQSAVDMAGSAMPGLPGL